MLYIFFKLSTFQFLLICFWYIHQNFLIKISTGCSSQVWLILILVRKHVILQSYAHGGWRGGGWSQRRSSSLLKLFFFYFRYKEPFNYHFWSILIEKELFLQTSQELRMLSNVTLNCQVAKIVMNSGSQLSEL